MGLLIFCLLAYALGTFFEPVMFCLKLALLVYVLCLFLLWIMGMNAGDILSCA